MLSFEMEYRNLFLTYPLRISLGRNGFFELSGDLMVALIATKLDLLLRVSTNVPVWTIMKPLVPSSSLLLFTLFLHLFFLMDEKFINWI